MLILDLLPPATYALLSRYGQCPRLLGFKEIFSNSSVPFLTRLSNSLRQVAVIVGCFELRPNWCENYGSTGNMFLSLLFRNFFIYFFKVSIFPIKQLVQNPYNNRILKLHWSSRTMGLLIKWGLNSLKN